MENKGKTAKFGIENKLQRSPRIHFKLTKARTGAEQGRCCLYSEGGCSEMWDLCTRIVWALGRGGCGNTNLTDTTDVAVRNRRYIG